MPHTVQDLCQAIEQNKLIPSREMTYLRNRWFRPTRKEVDQVEKFSRWLVANNFLTEFVVQSLLQGDTNVAVFDPYKVRERLRAGSYLATDPLNRSVVIEVFTPNLMRDPGVAEIVHQVIQRVIEISHPNVGRFVEVRESKGGNFLVKADYHGESLAAILGKRGRIRYQQASKLFAMAFAGLHRLHKANVSGGDLNSDCLVLTESRAEKKGKRTVKILHAGIPRRFFDNAFQVDATTLSLLKLDVPGDIFRMGCLFYRTLTGQAPFPDEAATAAAAVPVCRLAPDIPAMLAELVEECIDHDPGKRPRKASQVAKTLRVFLASEEEANPEETLVMPDHPAPKSATEVPQEVPPALLAAVLTAVRESLMQEGEEQLAQKAQAILTRKSKPHPALPQDSAEDNIAEELPDEDDIAEELPDEDDIAEELPDEDDAEEASSAKQASGYAISKLDATDEDKDDNDGGDGEGDDDEDDEAPARQEKKQKRRPATEDGAEEVPATTFAAVVQRWKPRQRDLVFLGVGSVAVIGSILLLHLFTHWQMINLVCLLAGTTLTFLVDQLIRWRENAKHSEPDA